jgi:hypothetical protein
VVTGTAARGRPAGRARPLVGRPPAGRARLLVPLARAGYGAALLCVPGPMIGAVTGQPPTARARQVARVLGVRHLAQAAVTVVNSGPEVVALGVVVDLLHAASMFAFAAAAGQSLRRAELTDALAATALAIAEPAVTSRPHRSGAVILSL